MSSVHQKVTNILVYVKPRQGHVEVEGAEGQRLGAERGVVTVGDRATPMMLEHTSFDEVFEAIALRPQRRSGLEIGVVHA